MRRRENVETTDANIFTPVKLANSLLISLEPRDDVALQLKRDQWLTQQLKKNQ